MNIHQRQRLIEASKNLRSELRVMETALLSWAGESPDTVGVDTFLLQMDDMTDKRIKPIIRSHS